MSAKDKASQAWSAWLGDLGTSARKSIRGELPRQTPADEDANAYKLWRSQLCAAAQEVVDGLVLTSATPAGDAVVDSEGVRFCLVECPDGEFPVLRVFRTAEALARRLQQLEGGDVTAWAFYGIPLPITQGPQRYVLLPDRQTGMSIPVRAGEAIQQVDLALLDEVVVQEDGFLGPPELAAATSKAKTRVPLKKPRKRLPPPLPDDGEAAEAPAE